MLRRSVSIQVRHAFFHAIVSGAVPNHLLSDHPFVPGYTGFAPAMCGSSPRYSWLSERILDERQVSYVDRRLRHGCAGSSDDKN